MSASARPAEMRDTATHCGNDMCDCNDCACPECLCGSAAGYTTSRDGYACPNAACICPSCSCGTDCSCGLPATTAATAGATCDPCIEFRSSGCAAPEAGRTITLKVEGMMCGNCTGKVQRALEAVAGVTVATVDLGAETATVQGSLAGGAAVLVDAVESVGHDCSVVVVAEPLRVTSEPQSEGAVRADSSSLSSSAEAALARVAAERDAAKAEAEQLRRMLEASLSAAGDAAADESSDDDQTEPLLLAAPAELETGWKVMLKVGEMTCASCSARVEKELQRHGGVQTVDVNLILGKAAVSFDPAATTADAIVDAVNALGFPSALLGGGGGGGGGGRRKKNTSVDGQGGQAARLPADDGQAEPAADDGANHAVEEEARMWQRLLRISLGFTVPLFFIAMVLPDASESAAEVLHTPVLGIMTACDEPEAIAYAEAREFDTMGAMTPCAHAMTLGSLLSWVLCTPVQFYVGATFYRCVVRDCDLGHQLSLCLAPS